MSTKQVQDLCVFENETLTINLEVFDENDVALDLTGHTLLMVVWTPPDGASTFTKNSGTPAEITIDPDQVTNPGKAKIFILPADVPASGVFRYNIWLDLSTGEQHLIVIPSRFEVLIAKRS